MFEKRKACGVGVTGGSVCTGMRLRAVSEMQDTDSVSRNNRKLTGQINDTRSELRDREQRSRQTGEVR